MLRQIIIFNAFCVFFAASIHPIYPGPEFKPTKGEVWPKPQQQKKYNTYFKLPLNFKFTVTDETCHILKSAIDRYTKVLKNTFHIAWKNSGRMTKSMKFYFTDYYYNGVLEELEIALSSPCEEYPNIDMNERYSINVSTVSTISSSSIWGILRGMETFVQLFYIPDDSRNVFINRTEIVDFPRYIHRGLLIDTSRHYISVPNILKTLDAMEMNKMNVFHWHIVDDQSFPYQSAKFPNLSAQGAYHSSMVYTKENISLIVNYARDRAIRVVPEFDVPGHTISWGAAYPNILSKCYSNGKVIGLGPMDPTNNMTYKLIGELFQEVQERFPDRYFHVGGDEVDMSCWLSNPQIRAFMTKHHLSSAGQLHRYFMKRIFPMLSKNRKPIVWQEVFDEGAATYADTLIQVWKSVEPEELVQILRSGLRVIYSASWYLDHLSSGGDWIDFYTADPRRMIPKSAHNIDRNNIIGGEACMWGEVVDDRNLMPRVWPRTSAVAEKLWSADQYLNYFYLSPPNEVYHRIEEHACRMVRRGVDAQPPNGPGFCLSN